MQNDKAGPGAIADQGIAPKPLLEGATEYEVVTIFNPLPIDFVGLVGQSKPVSLPFEVRKDGYTTPVSTTESDVLRNYGITLKNKDHQAKLPITNKVLIPSGKTINIFGNEAQVIVKQLVNEIMQRDGKRLLLADPYQRGLVEQTIVHARRSTADAISGISSVQDQLQAGMDKINERDSEAFPGLTARETESGTAPTEPSKSRIKSDKT